MELAMFRQTGMTVLELLIGLSIMSGVSLYTMEMTEEVEEAVAVYQNRVLDVQTLKAKLNALPKYEATDVDALLAEVEGEQVNGLL